MRIRLFAMIAVLTMTSALWANDMSALHPPAGARMALVVWEDLECPACAAADPLLLQAERNYNIPLVRHDFIIPNHNWSRDAHVMARYFDSKSPKLGEEFRQYIFANQRSIYNQATLREWADKFALAHLAPLPAFYDSDGKFHAMVEADTQLGRNTGPTGVQHTPTIWVVTDSSAVPPREVPETSKLFETIDAVKAALPPAKSNATKGAKKKVSSKMTESSPVKSSESSASISSVAMAKTETAAPLQSTATAPEKFNWTPWLILAGGGAAVTGVIAALRR